MKTISTIITLLLLGSSLQAQPGPCSGNGTFVDSGQAVGPGAKSSDVALADFDGDGDLDMVVANGVMNSQPTRVFFNNGLNSGNFVDSGQSLPANGSYAVAVGDINGDTHPDFVVANGQTQPNRVFFNDGNGNFTDSGQLLGNSYSIDIALGDIDGDTDLDLIVANWAGQSNRIYINDGLNSGNFIDSQQSLGALHSAAVVLGDIDGDNDLDLIFGSNANDPSEIWINQGGAQQGNLGVFLVSPQTLGTASGSATFCLALDDLNGDSYPDLVQGNYNGTPSQLYFNDGTGNFTNSGQIIDTPGGGTMGVALGDVDGDLDLDLVYAKVGYNTVWINTGGYQGGTEGQFVNSFQTLGVSTPGGQTISSFSLALGDVDGDTDLDIVVVNYDQPNQVYLNVAGGPDCNQNGNPDQCDIASGTSEDCNLNDIPDECDILANPSIDCDINGVIDSCELAQQTTFFDSGQLLGNSYSWGVDLGDLDGDGDLDAYVCNLTEPNRVWVNQGGAQMGLPGVFLDSGQALGSFNSTDIALEDLDGDHDLDAFVTNINQNTGVWMNQGGAQMGQPGVFGWNGNGQPGGLASFGSDLGDLDNNGTIDAFVLHGADNVVMWNSGGGQFLDSGQNLGFADSRGISLGDLDGDTDLDAFVVNSSSQTSAAAPNKVWLNQGVSTGTFIDSGQTLGSSFSRDVELEDLDGDGDLDAFVANLGGVNRVFVNQGGDQLGTQGVFQDSGQMLVVPSGGSNAVSLGDIDGDGDFDAFIASGGPNRFWVNQGGAQLGTQGVFFDSTEILGNNSSLDIALGDLDGDGDLDAFVANYGFNTVWINNNPPLDCNQNGIPDHCDINANPALDCDENLLIDMCEIDADPTLDCNENFILDFCDIASGFSLDTDISGIPDECELFYMKYISGDGNGDGVVNVGDGIFVLDYLFGGGVSSCLDASDVNGDGVVDIGDAVYLLTYLFNGGSTPAAPFPDCGEDPSADALECDHSGACL